ncbi:acetyl-CoA carboxylase biotin carboxylase subunit [Thermofilum pendens]|uniref:Pyruvate carboxylase subunit A n=1 Tax=Thermofilum pendens (strain DSM 2475 / Hrk 5) TaxID=368408 RepID=A1RWE9_THEPD|nr:biotin carboxylase N-terminal domain-containing protein [Thermofilum pendens]ABL77529.1 pyruvate carboxylase subunit A [Thermofilum pendens Hrk 5]
MGEIRKLLVANRGEIAVRIFRTARDLGIKTVAVYSDADKLSLHRLLADESYYLGPPEPAKSYLNAERIVKIAVSAGADAVHPGYGFLSQNPSFARMVIEEGLIWVGPKPETMKLVGDKLGARKFFSSKGIPVVPGAFEAVDFNSALSIAEEIGFPVIVKPAGGGGGIGMFVAHTPEDLEKNLEKARQLAGSAFARTEVYVEKYFPRAKHIEVQILGDKRGRVVHLFERECSVQRRYQKVVEEAPSPSLTQEEREKLLSAAVKAAEACGYENAGTFEFLFDVESRNFYFLEVNSRIQVEHPVTELVTGLDIVKLQLTVAEGGEIPFRQGEVQLRGHAIEARVYAEDPSSGFIPSPGRITYLREPAGPWVRVDSGVYEGFEVPPFYDPLLMKVVSWGQDREEARTRLLRALNELRISGVKHNKYLIVRVLEDARFRDASYTTRLLEDPAFYENLLSEDPAPDAERRIVQAQEGGEKGERTRINAWRVLARIHPG